MADELPNGARIWNNQARLSLSKGLYAWLALLVCTCLASVFFVRDHIPARFVLGGFIVSHLIVFTLPAITRKPLRIGMVGWLHIICWGPGWFLVLVESTGSTAAPQQDYYFLWGNTWWVLCWFSFCFDLHNGWAWLEWRKKRRPS